MAECDKKKPYKRVPTQSWETNHKTVIVQDNDAIAYWAQEQNAELYHEMKFKNRIGLKYKLNFHFAKCFLSVVNLVVVQSRSLHAKEAIKCDRNDIYLFHKLTITVITCMAAFVNTHAAHVNSSMK